MVKAVIFDIDGTLIDSVDLHAEAWQEALRHFGHDLTYGRSRRSARAATCSCPPVAEG